MTGATTLPVKASYAGFRITAALCRVAWQRALWANPHRGPLTRTCPTCRKKSVFTLFHPTFDGGRMGYCFNCRSRIAEAVKGLTSISRITEAAKKAGEELRGEV